MMSICLFVPKDLTNRWNDMILFYSAASPVGPGKVYNYFGVGYHHHPEKYTP